MAMFSRRSLQRLLDGLDGKLPLQVREKLAHELNRLHPAVLGFEWELVLLYALSQLGCVKYEDEVGEGSRRPDISFTASNASSLQFVADVATVSDAGLDEENPIDRFGIALEKLKRKHGLTGTLNYSVSGATAQDDLRDRKLKLKLPARGAIDRFVAIHVGPMFQRIANEGLSECAISVSQPTVEFSVNYSEAGIFTTVGYPSYTAAYSLTRNPVYTALKSKARQLKQSGALDNVGVFLCDGGCELLSKSGWHMNQTSLDQVVFEFFRQNSSIKFVVVMRFQPKTTDPDTRFGKGLKVIDHIYTNPNSTNDGFRFALGDIMRLAISYMPEPAATPINALHWVSPGNPELSPTMGEVKYGGNVMSQYVKISARKVQEILAGKRTAQDVFAEYDAPGQTFQNPFEIALRQGLTIDRVVFTKLQDIDDDQLEISFGLPDAAISKIRSSRQKSGILRSKLLIIRRYLWKS